MLTYEVTSRSLPNTFRSSIGLSGFPRGRRYAIQAAWRAIHQRSSREAIRLTIRSGEFTYSACDYIGGDGIQSAMIQSLACIQFGLYSCKQDMPGWGRVIQDGQAKDDSGTILVIGRYVYGAVCVLGIVPVVSFSRDRD